MGTRFVDGGACTYAHCVDSGQGEDKREIRMDARAGDQYINLECKDHKTLKIKEWWKQTVDASTLTDTAPCLAFHLHGTSTDLIATDADTFILLVKLAREHTPLSHAEEEKIKTLTAYNKQLEKKADQARAFKRGKRKMKKVPINAIEF